MAQDNGHRWVGASNVPLTGMQAAYAERRGNVRIKAEVKVDVVETWCFFCRGIYRLVLDTPCPAAADNAYLRGGPIKERRKRKGMVSPGFDPEAAPVLTRP